MEKSVFLDRISAHVDIGYLLAGMAVAIVLLVILLIVFFVVQNKKYNKLKSRLDKFVLGKDGKSLEQDIVALYEDNKFLKIGMNKNKENIDVLFQNMKSTFQKMGLVKYDAFQQMGGQLSYCLALLDENDNGFIINSVHSTEGCYSYTKEIKRGGSAIPLGTEEEEALSIALGEV